MSNRPVKIWIDRNKMRHKGSETWGHFYSTSAPGNPDEVAYYIAEDIVNKLVEVLKAQQEVIEDMRLENRLHGHITDASSRYLHHVGPQTERTLAEYEAAVKD